MTPSGSIGLWGILFVGTHMVLPAGLVRPRLVSWLGERGYRLVYWLVSLITFLPFVVLFARHQQAGPLLWDFAAVPTVWWLSHLLMIAALVILIAGLVDKSPASMFGGSTEVSGILKLTRSPVFIGLSLFGISHVLMNGSLAGVLFFGSFPALGLVGGWHQDRRKASEAGGRLVQFIEETSLLPGLALVRGKQRWTASDMPWVALAVALVVYVAFVFLGLHSALVGGDPLGW